MSLSATKCSALLVAVLGFGMGGCYNHQFQYRVPVLGPVVPPQSLSGYATVGIIEFDDMGELWNRCDLSIDDKQPCQLKATLEWITRQRQDAAENRRSSVLVVFIHGWNNNADSRNQNLTDFQRTLWELQEQNQKLVSGCSRQGGDATLHCAATSPKPIQYIGVYVGWRGRTLPGWTNYLTVFGRESGARRVASVSSTEVVFRLQQSARKSIPNEVERGRFILVGHSFGGLIVERTLAQALTAQVVLDRPEPESKNCSGPSTGYEPFADLVVLINPAIEALETQQLIDMMKRSRFHTCPVQDPASPAVSYEPPLLVSVKARNDVPTGGLFRTAHTLEELDKAFRSYPNAPALEAPGEKVPTQRTVFASTVGYISFFHNYCYVGEFGEHDSRDPVCNKIIDEVTHAPQSEHIDLAGANPQVRFSKGLPKVSPSGTYHQAFAWIPPMVSNSYQLSRLYTRFDPTTCSSSGCDVWNNTPYWIFTVPRSVIDGHNGFWTDSFRDLLMDIVQATMQKKAKRVGFQ